MFIPGLLNESLGLKIERVNFWDEIPWKSEGEGLWKTITSLKEA